MKALILMMGSASFCEKLARSTNLSGDLLFLYVARLANGFAVLPPPSICIPALLGRLVAVTYKNFVPKDDKNAAVTKKPAGKRKL